MGIGHIMRCLTIAKFLKAKSSNVFFICRKHKGNLIYKIKDAGFAVLELENNAPEKELMSEIIYSSWLGSTINQDADETINLLKNLSIDWLIIDHYSLDEYWHKKLQKYCKKLLVIDDMADKNFYCHVLVNQNLGIHKKAYEKKLPSNCKLLIGTRYTLLRNEFFNLREEALKKRNKTKEIKNILISFGGVDPQNITLKVLKKIKNKNLNVTVVLGYESPHIKSLEKYCINRNIRMIIGINNMAKEMLKADISIGASGSTSWERCCLGLPTLLYIIADNQKEIAYNLEKFGAAKIIDNLEKDLGLLLNNINLWKKMSDQASKICDGLGLSRVATYLK